MPSIEPWETPYDDGEHAFFAMLEARELKNQGARMRGGMYQRPGNGLDVEILIKKLYSQRKLTDRHIRVLTQFGKQRMPPDPTRPKEEVSAKLWSEAISLIEQELQSKGMIYDHSSSR